MIDLLKSIGAYVAEKRKSFIISGAVLGGLFVLFVVIPDKFLDVAGWLCFAGLVIVFIGVVLSFIFQKS